MNLKHKILTFLIYMIVIVVSGAILALVIRGNRGNPRDYDLLQDSWKINGPFELSPERGRYALIYSLLENNSYYFSPYLAVFTSPDVAFTNNQFVSLFPPGLSYIVIPGYLIGRYFDMAQIGTFAVVSLFAIANMLMIYALSRRLSAHPAASLIASLIFLFATPAFSYAATLYQHHVTTFLLLLTLLLLTGKSHWSKLFLLWLLIAVAIVTDAVNAVFFLPIGFYTLSKFIEVKRIDSKYVINFKISYIFTFIAVIFPLLLLLNFNNKSYGNPYQLGGTVSGAKIVGTVIDPVTNQVSVLTEDRGSSTPQKKSILGFFKTRNAMNGLYELFLSVDRGVIFFSPVILIGILGIGRAQKKNNKLSAMLLSTIGTIVLIYSIWGDPYGGWAFGPRYLVPAFALFSPFLAVTLTKYRREAVILILFLIFTVYSLGINTMGALTSNTNPPHNELVAMMKNNGAAPPEGYLHNYQQLIQNKSKSFFFNSYFHSFVSLQQYAYIILGTISGLVLICLIWLITSKIPEEKHDN